MLIAIGLMVLDKRTESLTRVRSLLTLPLTPLYYLVSWPTRWVDQAQSVFRTYDNLIKENIQLKTDKLLLQAKLQRFLAIESENTYLKALLQSASQVKAKTLIGELLAIDPEPFVHQVILDKGTHDGIFLGQPVLDASGIFGQVIQVGPFASRILLINDPKSGISVQNARNGARAFAIGDSYTGHLKLMYLPKTADLKLGDIYLSSGLGDHYPEGYPVGKIISIDKDPAYQFAKVILEPSARLDSSRQVLLVWYKNHA